jgi:indolepyruvate ferredoxin oxidoreductase beta subunit
MNRDRQDGRDGGRTQNILFVGLGGQGILKASEICTTALFRHGYAVKQTEVHGMSQRGGSVTSEVRFGRVVYSPLIPLDQVDFLVALHAGEGERNRALLRPGGCFLTIADCLDVAVGPDLMANTVMLGRLAVYLDAPESVWSAAIVECVRPNYVAVNQRSFDVGLTFERTRREAI